MPFLRKDLCVQELDVNYKELIESLRNNWDLSRVSRLATTIVYRPMREVPAGVATHPAFRDPVAPV